MIYVFAALLLSISLIAYAHYRHLFNPITLMFGLWAIIIPLSSKEFYGIAVADYSVYGVIAVGLLSYLIGVVCANNRVRVVLRGSHERINATERYERGIDYGFLYVLSAISLVYFGIIMVRLVPYIKEGNLLAVVRDLAVSSETNELKSSTLIIVLKNFIATPTARLLVALLPVEWVRGRRDKPLIVFSLLIFVLDILTTGGRASILLLGEYSLCVLTMRMVRKGEVVHKGKLSMTQKVLLFGLGVLLFFFLLKTTYSRKGADVDIFRQVFIYYVAPIKFFEYNKNLIDTVYKGFLGFGTASLYGFFYPFVFLFKLLGFYSEYPQIFVTSRFLSFTMLEESVHLGETFTMNAYATMVFQPYIDGRWIGVVILCFALGYFTNLSYRKARQTGDIKWLLIYLLFFQKIMNSEVRYYFTMPGQAICLIYALFAVRKKESLIRFRWRRG